MHDRESLERAATVPVTELLNRWCGGDSAAAFSLFEAIYPSLKRVARSLARRAPRREGGLETTELVHEAFLRLEQQRSVAWSNREQLYAVASLLMRRVIVDDMRARGRKRRGGDLYRVALEDMPADGSSDNPAMELGDAIEKLEKVYPRPAAVVTMRYFGGMSTKEVGLALDLSISTVEADVRLAKAWLKRELTTRP